MVETVEESTVSDEICPYKFKPDKHWGSSEGNDKSDSNCNGEHASFTEQLGNTLWCCYMKYQAILSAIKCLYCHELDEVVQWLESEDKLNNCITKLVQF